MIRALFISLGLAAPLAAQTPVETSAANDLRVCILGAQGFRDATRLAQLDESLEQIRARNWGQLTEIAPGVFRMARNGTDRTVEIKLPGADGTAHCMAFGPSIGPGLGALTADKFVELSFLSGFVPATPGPGMSRRYSLPAAPYPADLIAVSSAQHGELVGFSFSNVPQGLKTRKLSAGDPNVTYRGVSTALSRAVEVCLRNYFSNETVEAALANYGFEFGFETGGRSPQKIHFTSDNAVSVKFGPGSCEIDTNYIGPGATVNIVTDALNNTAPGQFQFRNKNHNGCPAFFAAPSLNAPLSLNVMNADSGGRATCIENGTSRITFVVAG